MKQKSKKGGEPRVAEPSWARGASDGRWVETVNCVGQGAEGADVPPYEVNELRREGSPKISMNPFQSDAINHATSLPAPHAAQLLGHQNPSCPHDVVFPNEIARRLCFVQP